MEKKFQIQEQNGNFYSYYSLGEEYEPLDFIKDVKAADFGNSRATIYEDVDGEMMTISGGYSIASLIESYSDLMEMALYPEDVSIVFSGNTTEEEYVLISLNPFAREVVLVSGNPNLDIEDVVKKNDHGKVII